MYPSLSLFISQQRNIYSLHLCILLHKRLNKQKSKFLEKVFHPIYNIQVNKADQKETIITT